MKVDTSRLKKGTSEVPPECQQLIDRLRQCSHEELFTELSKIETWTFGKCELYHWIDILDIFDSILEQATEIKDSNEWCLACDISFDEKGIKLLLLVLNFTTLLIEHSFSRHLYNSVEHLTRLLSSSNMEIVLGVLNLLYMFSKRSNFISRLNSLKKNSLLTRLNHIAESWGGKEYGFGLANCCREETTLPAFASTFFYEYYNQEGTLDSIEIPDLDKCSKHPAQIAQSICEKIEDLDDDQKMHIFTRIRLSVSFHKYPARLQFVQARLQALSVLVYSNSLQENIHTLLYPGFLEELVELLEMKEPHLVEIRAAALRTLTSIIHLDRNPHFPKKPGSRLAMIIDVTGASSYHGFLPTLVRTCIQNLTASTIPINMNEDAQRQQQTLEQVQFHDKTMHKIQTLQLQQNLFPLPLATALFSFLYHLASYELGGDALVACGMMESLLKVINWPGYELEHITFVTRAVRVIDLITNIEMQSFQNHGGLNSFIGRLDMEVNICRREQPFEIEPQHDQQTSANNINIRDVRDDSFLVSDDTNMSTDDVHPSTSSQSSSSYSSTAVKVSTPNLSNSLSFEQNSCNSSSSKASKNAKTCLPQRAALLKSMLNFLKKAIQDPSFSESIRHVMEGTLPSSLRHIISNAEYYGPSLFLLATDVVTVYVFQEPSLLSSLQDNGLTDVVLQALLKKDVPATREVLGSLPNVFSALCLNARGLAAFVKYNPFDRLFKVLLSPVYLLAMRRRRSSDPMGDTASNLGNAMDELMRHQPSLKSEATKAIIKLLEELVTLGTDPKYICWRATTKNETSPTPQNRQTNGNTGGDAGSSDEEDDDEEEASTSSHHNQREDNSNEATTTNNSQHEMYERTPIPLIDYILNVMKFVDAILSNNSTDDHCREFVLQGGLKPLLSILALPNLPVDSPITASAQAVAAVCKSILNLAHEPQVLQVGLEQLAVVVDQLKPLQTHNATSVSSVLLHELATCPNIHAAFSNASYTPLLHAMSAVHGYIVMLVHLCRTGQTDIRTLLLTKWAQNTPYGKKLLKNLVDLYTSLVWESTLLLALCTDDIFPAGCDFGKEDIEKLPSDCPEETMSNSDANILSCVKVIKSGSQASNGMDLDSNSEKACNRDDDQKTAGKKIMATPGQLRYIKALLGASSRLGRALAELFGNLVKLCVGSPIRRRGQNFPPTPVFTSTESRDIARVLSYVLVDGFSHEKLLPSPVLKLKFTFFICSVGFTGPMLFDEKRYAFHLILHKFVEEGGLEAFFDMFRWVITAGEPISIKTAISNQNFADGTGEFLDAWLMLLEKMVNTKAILESPHIISTRAVRSKSEFDATLYLITIHRMAFNTVTQLWGMKPLPTYGVRMTESIMSILKHILKSDILLKEKYKKRMANVSESNSNVTSDHQLLVNQEHLRQLMDMGFSREHVTNALLRTFSMEQATDYLLNQCSPPPLPAEVITQQSPQQQQASSANRPDRSSTPLMFQMDLDGEDDHSNRASVVNMGQSSKYRRKYILPTEPLSDKVLNRFSKTALEKCLYLMDQLPETVSKGVELMAILYERNSTSWKFDFLNELADQLSCCMKVVSEGFKDSSKHEDIFFGEWSNKFYVRLLVCCLFCDEMYTDIRIEMAHRLKGRDCEFDMIHLVPEFLSCIKKHPPPSNNNGERTPRWLAQIVTLLDLLEKVSVYTQRKYDMHKVTTRVWKWYDVASGKWNAYSVSNNRIINEAYWSGEPSVRVSCGRQRYAINFNCMSQVNEETGNHRPVILALKATENKHETQSEETLPMSLITSDESEGETDEKTKQTREHKLYENEYDISFRLQGLDIYPTREIVANLVQLMSSEISVSRDALHAIMKFLVRLTKTYENAKIFAQEGGVRLLLNMKQSCGYIGFPTLSILLIRHVLEEPKTLELAMERVISNRTIQSIPPGYRDLVFLLRQMSSAISRDPDTFEKVAKAVLRVDISVLKRNPVNEDNRLLLKSIPSTKRTEVMEEPVSIEVVHDLLNALVIPCPHSSSSEQSLIQPSTDGPHNKAPNHPIPSDSNTPSSSMTMSIASPAREAVHAEILDSNAVSHDARNPFQHMANANSAVNTNIPLPSSSHQNRRSRLGTYTLSDSHRSNDKEDDCCGWHIPCQTREHDKPLLPKGTILKFLADAVRSYQTLAPLITGHVYRAGISPLITENTSALSFILDKLLTSIDASVNREVSSMCRVLIAALASCSEQTSVQYTVVSEVKAAINRALTLAESADKHSQLQILVGLIPTMIENCPSENSKNNLQPKRNDIFYIMVRKGLITDLAKLTQYLDLSSPHTIATINAVLKPLETLLRMTNQPGPVPLTSKNKKTQATGSTTATAASSSAAADGASTPRRSSNGDEQHGVRSSDIVIAPDEQIIDDQDQSEADMSGVDNMGLNNDTIQDNIDDIMEELLERAVNIENDRTSNRIGTSTDESRGDNLGNFHVADIALETSSESGDSESNASDNDEREIDEDDENEEEAEDRSEIDIDEGTRQYIEIYDHVYGRHLSPSIPELERDTDDILMIRYPGVGNNDQADQEASGGSSGTNPILVHVNFPNIFESVTSHNLSQNSGSNATSGNSLLNSRYPTASGAEGSVNNDAPPASSGSTMNRISSIANIGTSVNATAPSNGAASVSSSSRFYHHHHHHHHQLHVHGARSVGILTGLALSNVSNLSTPIIYISTTDNGNASTQVGSSSVNSSQIPAGNGGATSQSQSSTSHRLLSVPRAMRTQSGNSSSENSNIRQRRYQLLNWNSRNTPVILQRLLGPGTSNSNGNTNNGAQTQGDNQGSNSGSNAGHANVFRDAARVILMDNIFGGSTDEGSIDLVDQSGYLFGRSLAATLSSTPTALHWWLEEAKALGLESQSDICLTVANSLIPELESYKETELARVRSKRKKKPNEDESRAKGDNSAAKAAEEKENNLLTSRTDQQSETRDPNIEQGSGDNARNFVIGMDTADSNATTVRAAPSSQEQRTHIGGSEILTDSEELEQSSTSHNPTTLNTTNEGMSATSMSDFVSDTEHETDDGHQTPQVELSAMILPLGDENEVNDDEDEDEDDDDDDEDEEDEDDVANNSSEQESSEIGDEPVIFNRSNRDCLCVDQQEEGQQQNSPSNLHSNNDDSSNAAGDTIGDNESEEIDVEGLPYSIVMGSTSISLLPPPPPTQQAITDDEMAAAVLIPLPIDDDEEDFNDILQILDRTANITNSPRRNAGISETTASGQVSSGPTSANGTTESVANTQNRSNETQEEEGAVGGVPQRSRNTDDVLVFPPPRPDEACNDIPPLDPSEEIVEDSQDPPNVSRATTEGQINHNEHNQQVEAEADHVRSVLGDLEVPEGVDPSFLAALPHDMREEVIAEHLRLQRIRQRAQQNAVQFEHASVAEVNPEFLAALPPSIQEEVLAQQRIEQQRQAAATANPNDPVDAAAFFQNLQPSLRQAILTDMEDSQISVLPPDLAAEAQNLRRDWENRNRQLMQERLLHQIGSTANFSSVLRYRRGGFRFPGANMIRPRWTRLSTGGTSGEASSPSLMTLMERQGRPILDHEALTSLLILLFIDEPKFNTLRLHRVIRNLCCHVPTREWIIKSLLSIIERSNLNSSVASNTSPLTISTRPQWLNIRLDAALGSRANVFVIKKAIAVQGIADKVAENYIVSIHPQASQTVCKHTIDLLITLAKTFPKNFLPCKRQDTSSGINLDKHKSTSRSNIEKPGPSVGHSSANKNCTDFWDIIVKLDCSAPQRKARGPGTQSGSSNSQGRSSSSSQQEVMLGNKENVTFDESPFGQLISMLSYDIVKKSCQLTDKLLRLLSFISVGLPDEKVSMKPPVNETGSGSLNVAGTSTSKSIDGKRTSLEGSTILSEVQINESLLPNSEGQLLLAIEVLTSKSCSEEGLEDATSLLLNMSQCSNQTRTVILNLLIRGAKDLARMVKRQITDLMLELKEINCKHKSNFPTPTSTDTSPEEQIGTIHMQQGANMPSTSLVQLPCSTKTKGILQDRFTKETVIITAPTKVKQTCELQLTSMIPLISKTSSQAFFLRILKVIIQIREAVREAINKDENKSRIVLGPTELTPLSETLGLDDLWNTLSDCLLELEETADNHAVLVLQPAVEAFFLVHASQQNKSNRSNQRQRDEQQNSQRPGQVNDTNGSAAPAPTGQANQSRPNAPTTTTSQSSSSVVDPLSPITITFSHEYEAEEYDDSDAASTVTAPDAATATQEEEDHTANKQQPEEKQLSNTTKEALNADQKKFLQFAEKHRTVLNQILRQTTTHLSDGPFAVLVDHTRILDFDVKRRYFRTELDRLDEGIRREELAIHVHRVTVFEDSFRELYRRNPEEWKNRFYIVFEDEEGQDAGGLLREWYVIISREIFNPMYALFTVSPGDRVTYMINPSSHANPNHLCYYKFVGRVIAKAIYDNKLLECYFTRSFYKHILGTQVKYTDMESEDYGFYKGLVFLLENHISALGYELTFSLEVQEFGVTEVRDLIPNGRNIPVTEENKLEYIHLVCQLKMSGSIRQQLNAFLDGFYDIIPKRLISIFNEQELELLISGLPIVDIEDLKANTEYHKYQANSIQIQWFWRALRSFDQADRAKFLQFVTGTSKVPLQGFGALEGMNGIQKFQIHRDDRSTDRLPSAHTCFNQLDLPVYKTYDKLRSSLLKAIHECSEGFGFA